MKSMFQNIVFTFEIPLPKNETGKGHLFHFQGYYSRYLS